MVTAKNAAFVARLERFEHTVARNVVQLASKVPEFVLRRWARVVDGARLHPEAQLLLKLQSLSGVKRLGGIDPTLLRTRMRRDARVHAGAVIPVGAVRDLTIPGAAGPLEARHYAPRAHARPRPIIVFFHGGGFVTGDLDTHDRPCRALCRELDVHVLSVAYRLAPEHPFPAAVDDAQAALRHAQQHAADYGADPERVVIAGDSAGGNLAAVATLLAVRAGEPAPVLQILLYPTVDSIEERPSVSLFGEGFFLTKQDILWFREQYARGHDLGDPRLSPLRAPDLTGMPPAIIITAGFDPLRDEAEDYAERLRAAGNQVDLYRVPDQIHGFINFGSLSDAAHAAIVRVAGMARRRLEEARNASTTAA
ncbi:MAG: alpha/beta hydrolase [Polyangiales bacterium]